MNPELTPREVKLLDLIVEGLSCEEIGKKLGYTGGTIRVYLHNLYKRIGVLDMRQAAVYRLTGKVRPAVQPRKGMT